MKNESRLEKIQFGYTRRDRNRDSKKLVKSRYLFPENSQKFLPILTRSTRSAVCRCLFVAIFRDSFQAMPENWDLLAIPEEPAKTAWGVIDVKILIYHQKKAYNVGQEYRPSSYYLCHRPINDRYIALLNLKLLVYSKKNNLLLPWLIR